MFASMNIQQCERTDERMRSESRSIVSRVETQARVIALPRMRTRKEEVSCGGDLEKTQQEWLTDLNWPLHDTWKATKDADWSLIELLWCSLRSAMNINASAGVVALVSNMNCCWKQRLSPAVRSKTKRTPRPYNLSCCREAWRTITRCSCSLLSPAGNEAPNESEHRFVDECIRMQRHWTLATNKCPRIELTHPFARLFDWSVWSRTQLSNHRWLPTLICFLACFSFDLHMYQIVINVESTWEKTTNVPCSLFNEHGTQVMSQIRTLCSSLSYSLIIPLVCHSQLQSNFLVKKLTTPSLPRPSILRQHSIVHESNMCVKQNDPNHIASVSLSRVPRFIGDQLTREGVANLLQHQTRPYHHLLLVVFKD